MICAIDFSNLHTILRSLYDEMMPLCGDMAGVAQGIAGLGALFYVAYRIWRSLAAAEPIDVFPLLRPFVIGFCIMFFPTVVLGTINSVMSPIVQGTASMLEGQTLDMQKYREEKDRLEYEQMMKDLSNAQLVNLPVKLGIIHKVGGGWVFHHLLIFQSVLLLTVFLHIQCLPFEHGGRALHNR